MVLEQFGHPRAQAPVLLPLFAEVHLVVRDKQGCVLSTKNLGFVGVEFVMLTTLAQCVIGQECYG